MKIRIVANNPKASDEGDISHLEGEVFEVTHIDTAGHYIKYGETSLYLIHEDEFEVIKEEEA